MASNYDNVLNWIRRWGFEKEILNMIFISLLELFFLHTFHLTKFESVSWSFTFHSIKSFSDVINEIVGCFYEHRIVVTVFILCQHLPHLYWILQFLIMYWCTFHSVRYICSWEKLLWLDIVLEIWWAYYMNCSIK